VTFRDDRPMCLRCDDAGLEQRGTRWVCDTCHSKLIPARELEDALNEVSPDDYRELERRLIPSKWAARMCPLCKTVMSTWSIYDVQIEQCATHGLWIEANGEATMVMRNGEMFTNRNPRTPRGALWPLGIGIIVGALLSPWLDRRRLRKDIERTSPPKPGKR
jgi:hypothetical protein